MSRSNELAVQPSPFLTVVFRMDSQPTSLPQTLTTLAASRLQPVPFPSQAYLTVDDEEPTWEDAEWR